MRPKLIRLPALRLAGFVCSTTTRFGENFTAIPKFWRAYLNDGRRERLWHEDFIKSTVQYGVCFPEEPITGNFQYLIGMELKEGAAVPPGYEIRELPSAAYAVFPSAPTDDAHFTAEVYNTWAYIYGWWLPQSGLYMDRRSCDFELYDGRAETETGKICDVYVPVACAPGMISLPDIADAPGSAEKPAAPPVRSAQSSPKTTAVKV